MNRSGPRGLQDRIAALPALTALILLASVCVAVGSATARVVAANAPIPVSVQVAAELGDVDVVSVTPAPDDGRLDARATSPTLLVALDQVTGDVEALAMVIPGQVTVELNARSTAASLVYWSQEVQSGVNEEARLARAAVALRADEFTKLVADIAADHDWEPALMDTLQTLHDTRDVDCPRICSGEIRGERIVIVNPTMFAQQVLGEDRRVCSVAPPGELTVEGAEAVAEVLAGYEEPTTYPAPKIHSIAWVVESCQDANSTSPEYLHAKQVESDAEVALFELLAPGRRAHTHTRSAMIAELEAYDSGSTRAAVFEMLTTSYGRIAPVRGLIHDSAAVAVEAPVAPDIVRPLPPEEPTPTTLAPPAMQVQVRYSLSPPAGEWALDVTLANNGTRPLLIDSEFWRLEVGGGMTPPLRASDNLSPGTVLEPGQTATGELVFPATDPGGSALIAQSEGLVLRTNL